jgi:hypothetical protein
LGRQIGGVGYSTWSKTAKDRWNQFWEDKGVANFTKVFEANHSTDLPIEPLSKYIDKERMVNNLSKESSKKYNKLDANCMKAIEYAVDNDLHIRDVCEKFNVLYTDKMRTVYHYYRTKSKKPVIKAESDTPRVEIQPTVYKKDTAEMIQKVSEILCMPVGEFIKANDVDFITNFARLMKFFF